MEGRKVSLKWNLAAEKILKGRTENEGLQNDDGADNVASVEHDYGYDTAADHSQHQLFIKLEELQGASWVEKARWFKYEEDLDPDNGSWGKPHISQLSFQAVGNLRICLEKCTLLLDMVAHSYPAVVHKVVENSKTNEKVKAVLRNKLLSRDKGLRKKSYNFG